MTTNDNYDAMQEQLAHELHSEVLAYRAALVDDPTECDLAAEIRDYIRDTYSIDPRDYKG